VENRSLTSWSIERFFWLNNYKNKFKKKSESDWKKQLKNYSEISDKKMNIPSVLASEDVRISNINGMQVFIWNDNNDNNQPLIFYLHGGAYLSQPTRYHFKVVNNIAEHLDAKVVFPIYPKAPKHTYVETLNKLHILYQKNLNCIENPKQITFMGDSAGGGLALGFAMYARDHGMTQPNNIILLSPWLDVNTNNHDIKKFEKVDPILSAWGLHRAGLSWAGNQGELNNPYVSPLKGDFKNLGTISLFVGTHEIFFPDNKKLHQILNEQGIHHKFIIADKMNHVYAIYPTPEAKKTQNHIINIIKEEK